jgi:beta-lactam-binding protein with PASTA domain
LKVKRGRIVRSTPKTNRVLGAHARVTVVVSRGR